MAEEKEKSNKINKFLEIKLEKAKDPRYQVVDTTRPESRILVDFANQFSFYVTLLQRTEYTRTPQEDQIYAEFKKTFKRIVTELNESMMTLQPLLDKMPTIKGKKALKITNRGVIKSIVENSIAEKENEEENEIEDDNKSE